VENASVYRHSLTGVRTRTDHVEIFQPIGHASRRAEGLSYLRRKLERNLALALPEARLAKIMRLFDQGQNGGTLPVSAFLDLFVPDRSSSASAIS